MKSRNQKRHAGRNDLPFVDPLFAEEMSSRVGRGSEQRQRKTDHKTAQLCRQVQRALTLALAGECNDDLLRGLYVESVVPGPDAAHLLVRVVVPSQSDRSIAMEELLASLERAHGTLRTAVAQAITRKRAPELSFLPLLAGEVQP